MISRVLTRGTWRVILVVTLMRHAGDLGTCLAMLETPSARASGMRCATPSGCLVTPTRVALPLTPRSSGEETAAVALAPAEGAAAQHLRKAVQTQEQARWCAHPIELLRQKGCEVHGIKRRSSLINTDRINHFQ